MTQQNTPDMRTDCQGSTVCYQTPVVRHTYSNGVSYRLCDPHSLQVCEGDTAMILAGYTMPDLLTVELLP